MTTDVPMSVTKVTNFFTRTTFLTASKKVGEACGLMKAILDVEESGGDATPLMAEFNDLYGSIANAADQRENFQRWGQGPK